jgi:hypothetical protein
VGRSCQLEWSNPETSGIPQQAHEPKQQSTLPVHHSRNWLNGSMLRRDTYMANKKGNFSHLQGV